MTMQDYTNYCTAEQTRRAYKLGAPVNSHCDYDDYSTTITFPPDDNHDNYWQKVLEIPTTQQIIGWLRKEKHFSFNVTDGCFENINIKVAYGIELLYDKWGKTNECVLTAIDAALDYLEKGGTK